MSRSNYDALVALGIPLKRMSGQEKTICPNCSAGRKPENRKEACLSVNITTGQYNCKNGCGFAGGVGSGKSIEAPERVYVKPPEWRNVTALSDKMVQWFKSRGISQRTLMDMRISEGVTWMPAGKKVKKRDGQVAQREAGEVNAIQFPYFRAGELINVKYRSGDKAFRLFKDAELIFFNLDGIAGEKEIIITEGEIDTLSLIEAGMKNSCSVPNGATLGTNALMYLDNCYDAFANAEKIILAVDNDEPGRALRDELIRRLGAERCWTVDFGEFKDANEVVCGKVREDESKLEGIGVIGLTQIIAQARRCPLEGVLTMDELQADVVDLFNKGLPPGDGVGIRNEEGEELVTFVPGQMTIMTGIPNHGKSDFVDFIMTRLAVLHDWRFAVFSPENHPIQLHVSKLVEKLIGSGFSKGQHNPHYRMNHEQLQQAMSFMRERIFFISPKDDNFSLDSVLDHALKLVRRHGVKGLIIDPWNTLEHQIPQGTSETSYISTALAKMTAFNRRNGVHTFLVAHPKKMEKNKMTKKYEVPSLYDISGSANFFNKADNGMTMYRDFKNHTSTVHIQKIKFKHQGKVGIAEYTYDAVCGRYVPLNCEKDVNNWITDGIKDTLKPPPPVDPDQTVLNYDEPAF